MGRENGFTGPKQQGTTRYGTMLAEDKFLQKKRPDGKEGRAGKNPATGESKTTARQVSAQVFT